MHDSRIPAAVVLSIWLLSSSWTQAADAERIRWKRLSSITGELPTPNTGDQQTCCVVLDIDRDGVNDFVVGERTQAPSVVWYKCAGSKWQKYVIEAQPLRPEAGGDSCDVDGDGDLDLILGQDSSGVAMWWWENPYPDFSQPWKRRDIKNSGGRQHHDQAVADFDGDGQAELVSWNQKARLLLLFQIPDDPRTAARWPATAIYNWSGDKAHEGFPSLPVDIDLDGKLDIVGGGHWFKHEGGERFVPHLIDKQMTFTQCAAGQLVKGGRPEVVFSPGDADGDAFWYEWRDGRWLPHKLQFIIHGHTCEVRDVDGDGNLDVFLGEMGSPGAGDQARTFVWYGDGRGGLVESVVSIGQGIHEGQVADLDGDGDTDILMKPYHHNAPRIDILIHEGSAPSP